MLQRLREFLDANGVPYQVHAHRNTVTAVSTARADHVPQSEMAKVVMVRARDGYLMAVLPASRRLDLGRLRAAVGDPSLQVAGEDEMSTLFPGCETGAMPPFGALFGLPVWVDDSLGREHETVFNAGNHSETVHMAYRDFVRLASPCCAAFAVPAPPAAPLF